MTAALAHAVDGGVLIRVRAAPRAKREGVEGGVAGPRGPALKIAVAAPPADGRANARLIEILAKALDVPKSAVSIRSGTASRDKTIFVAGDSPTLLDAVARVAPTPEKDHHG